MIYFDYRFSSPTGDRFLLRDIIPFITKINNYATNEDSRLLDVGCGSMPYKKLFHRYKYLGLDNNVEKRGNPDIEGSVDNIPIENESFDAVMSVWVLDDIFTIEKAILEISRVLKKGGYYFAVESQITAVHNPPYDYFRFAPNALIELCKKHDLEIIEYKSFGGDIAAIGFSIIHFCRRFFPLLRINLIIKPFYCLLINIIFYPLDLLFRQKIFKGKFEDNSIGYNFVFRKKL